MKGSASTFITDCYKKIDKDNEYFKGMKKTLFPKQLRMISEFIIFI